MSEAQKGHLQIAKELADQSGRIISDCMSEAADILVQRQHARLAPATRKIYALFLAVFAAIAAGGFLGMIVATPFASPWLISILLLAGLAGIFWYLPELPLLSPLWTRWNTPVFLASAAYSLLASGGGFVFETAKLAYFAIAVVAALSGLARPETALARRSQINQLAFHMLSPRDQARVFFLAPWINPFTWKRRR